MLQVLLADPRVNVNLCGSDGCTPLWFACYSRQRAVVQRMMLSGREIDWDKKGVHWDISYSPHDISLLEKDPETAVLLFQFKENPGKTRHQVGVDLLERSCLRLWCSSQTTLCTSSLRRSSSSRSNPRRGGACSGSLVSR